MGIFSWILLFCVLGSVWVNGTVDAVFHDESLKNAINNLSMYTILYDILGDTNLGSSLSNNGLDFFILALYCFVTLIVAYIVFIRRDVS